MRINLGLTSLGLISINTRLENTNLERPPMEKSLFKTIIKPSNKSIKEHYHKLAKIIETHKAAPQRALIVKLQPIITGWANYYRCACSKESFSKLDHLLYWKLSRWGFRRHPRKGKYWVNRKYWQTKGLSNWNFGYKDGNKINTLIFHAKTKIIRHIKVKGYSSPYDGMTNYWASRMGKHPEMKNSVARHLKNQKGKCNHCHLTFKPGDLLELDHKVPLKAGGHKYKNNLQILHRHCHDVKTKTDLITIKRYNIRQQWNKVHNEIQKQFEKSKWHWIEDIPTIV